MTKIIAVGIPKEAKGCWIHMNHVYCNIPGGFDLVYAGLGIFTERQIHESLEMNYSILGKLSELTDEQCRDLVREDAEWDGTAYWYKDYTKPEGRPMFKQKPKESFISKLKSEGKLCKCMFTASRPLFHSLPDDLLILIKK